MSDDMTRPQPGDPILDRLRDADPSGPDPDAAVLRERIGAAVVADAGADIGADHEGVGGASVHALRRRTPVILGAAAGVALLAGAALGGVAIGRSTAPETVVAAPEAEVPSGSIAPGNSGGGPAGTDGAPAPAGAEMGLSATSPMTDQRMAIWPGVGNGTEFTPAPGLPDESGTATGYRLRSQGIDIDALGERLAKVFGATLNGEDPASPSVWVSEDPLVSWSFSDPSRDPWACGAVEPMPMPEPAPDSGSSDQGSSPGSPGVARECPADARPIGERAARDEAERILARLGVEEVDGIGIEWETYSDEYTTQVTGWQTVEGLRTQLAWSFTFGSEGLSWANGFAAGLEEIPDLPVVGARTAVLRSVTPRWNAFGPHYVGGGMVTPMASDTVTSSPMPRAEGGPLSIELWWNPLTVTSAEPTLSQYWQADGQMLILPAYLITTEEDEGTWSVISIAESEVTFVTP